MSMRAVRIVVGLTAVAFFLGVTAPVPAASTLRTARSHRHAAARAAAVLIGRVVLPPGATRVSREPGGDGRVLSHFAVGTAAPVALIDRHAWWRVPGRPQAVLSFIEAHPPRGGMQNASGQSSAGRVNSFVVFGWPTVSRGAIGMRSLVVDVVALRGGATGVRADAQVVWIVPKPAGEQIPHQARVLDVSLARPGQAPSLSLTVTDAAKVRTIAGMIDRLPVAQPVVVSCPAEPAGTPSVTFTFRALTAGPVLARASEASDAMGATDECHPMSLTIRGRTKAPLLGGGGVLRKAQALLGLSLTGS